MFLKNMGIKREPESIGRRYISSIKRKYEVDEIEDLRKTDRRSRLNKTGGMGS
jgi:hypothetical protein